MAGKVVTVGSVNIDMTTYIGGPLPTLGQTVFGDKFETGIGGKGANQAVAACLAGSESVMVGAVGADAQGSQASGVLEKAGVELVLKTVDGVSTGVAPIWVTDAGANVIVVVPGANMELKPADVNSGRGAEAVASARVVLTQNEIPLETSLAALKAVKGKEGVVGVFNPAPAPSMEKDGEVVKAILAECDVVVPNESEAKAMTGVDVVDVGSGLKAARALQGMGAKHVIVTLGGDGALVVLRGVEGAVHVHAPQVTAVDTSGAGDCFLGVLAAGLAGGKDWVQAARVAVAAASVSVQGRGTQASFPSAAAIAALTPAGSDDVWDKE